MRPRCVTLPFIQALSLSVIGIVVYVITPCQEKVRGDGTVRPLPPWTPPFCCPRGKISFACNRDR